MKRLWGVGVAVVLAASSAGAQGTLYNNGAACCGLDGYGLGARGGPASNFTLSSDAVLTGVTFDVFAWDYVPTPPSSFTWSIFLNTTGNVPGTSVATGTSPFSGVTPTPAGTWTFTLPSVAVQANQTYWLQIGTVGGTMFSWRTTPFSADTIPDVVGADGHWTRMVADPDARRTFELTDQLAFSVLGTTAPEPSALTLLATGLLGVAPFLRKRRRA